MEWLQPAGVLLETPEYRGKAALCTDVPTRDIGIHG
jgi:hypothetical protein